MLSINQTPLIFLIVLSISCSSSPADDPESDPIYLGADLSYLNEMLDCGGSFLDNGKEVDPYELFAEKGANLVRLRLWHNPTWTDYSNLSDIKLAIRKSKELGMGVLLDFHYSDEWADPAKQLIPESWKDIESMEILGDSVYEYTYSVLQELQRNDLLPEIVQIGNETNTEVLMPLPSENYTSINWNRNVYLLNKGIEAVKDFCSLTGNSISTMIHIAQPENAEWWFPKAYQNGILDFDWIGLSYYPKWSKYSVGQLKDVIRTLHSTFSKRIMVVETAYPHSLINADPANNIFNEDALIEGYPATPEGQRDYMIAITKAVLEGGGEGTIYWEPAWISTKCFTRWGQGSHWDNATFFNSQNNNESLVGFEFFNHANYFEVR